ncbi:MAG TPA: carboxyl transferase domain-containing protein [Acidimicrobiales bacterium]|nr:carboxyl transferase domain-containing protein [Acidimicrobiales bacterium]
MSDVVAVRSPIVGTVVRVAVGPGDVVAEEGTIVVLESMKMEHPVRAPAAGRVRAVAVAVGQTVQAGDALAELEPTAFPAGVDSGSSVDDDEGSTRPELAELLARRAAISDEGRPGATARRHERGRRTARENIADLCDEGTFDETGSLVIAAQRGRRALTDLLERTPADGLVTGIGRVNGALFPPERSACAVLAYDYTVLAGTQGHMNHRKKDRLFELVERMRLPVVLFAEGGGGRPGDTDTTTVTGLDVMTFARFGRLSGLVPLVGVVAGYCFAGNAALLGCCDVIIATADANIGMGGPAMIEGGGLGTFAPGAIGPVAEQRANGVVDLVAEDEAHAVALAKRYLSYFQGAVDGWEAAEQSALRAVLPRNRLEVADMRAVAALLCDTGSVLELRPDFAPGMITALARLEGRPVGVLANDSRHLAGAIDAPGADKAARFVQLCDAFDLPIVSLVDTPGFMVGPEAERTALVRHVSRMFVAGASVTVPWCAVVVRRAYGLGAQAMAGGSLMAPLVTLAWPSGELGGMGLEGAVELGFRRELEAVDDPAERQALFDKLVQAAYDHGRAMNVASVFEVDEVIDPAETRARLAATLDAGPAPPYWRDRPRKRPNVDTW